MSEFPSSSSAQDSSTVSGSDATSGKVTRAKEALDSSARKLLRARTQLASDAGEIHFGDTNCAELEGSSAGAACQEVSSQESPLLSQSRTQSQSRPRLLRYRITRDEFLFETTEGFRALLAQEVESAVTFFLKLERSVHLEGFGFLSPIINSSSSTQIVDNQAVIVRETFISLRFEKCDDFSSSQPEKFNSLVETKDIAQRVMARMRRPVGSKIEAPYAAQTQSSEERTSGTAPSIAPNPPFLGNERELARYIRGWIECLKFEVVLKGYSSLLPTIGTWYALHNRQGENFAEWFAGSDVFLKPTFRHVLMSSQALSFERPVLQNAWELFEAANGAPLVTLSVDIEKELAALGYQMQEPSIESCQGSAPEQRHNQQAAMADSNPPGLAQPETGLPSVQVSSPCRNPLRSFDLAIFEQKSADNPTLIFCSDGLRTLSFQRELDESPLRPDPLQPGPLRPGNELVFQLTDRQQLLFQMPAAKNVSSGTNDRRWVTPEAIQLATRVLTLGWILMQGSKTGCLRAGAGISAGTPLLQASRDRGEPATTILVTPFSGSRSEQLAQDGPFYYLNLLAITEGEAKLAAEQSPEFLLTLLEYRKLDQRTKLDRPSITSRSVFGAVPTAYTVPAST
jgi:hypothetical protein